MFSLPVGGVTAPVTTEGGPVIARVTERQDVKPEEIATAREGLKSELLNEQRSRFFAAYMTKARERLKTTVDQATVRRVLESRVRPEGPLLVYRIEATAFLKHMVRNIVGVLVEIGRGERPPSWLGEVLASGDRTRAGVTAPPQGLTLLAVRY